MIETDLMNGPVALGALDHESLLDHAAEAETQSRIAERRKLRYAAQWATLNAATEESGVATWHPEGLPGELGHPESLGGAGTPQLSPYAAEPLAAAWSISPLAAMSLLADVLDLQHRLPLTWARVEALEVTGWRARRLAVATRTLNVEAAGHVDEVMAPRMTTCGVVSIDNAVAKAAAEHDPDALAAREARARRGWGVDLTHPMPGLDLDPSSHLEATGDRVDLSRFHELVNATAHHLGHLQRRDPDLGVQDRDDFGIRQARALGVITDLVATGTKLTDLSDLVPDPGAKTTLYVHLSLADLLDTLDEDHAGRSHGHTAAAAVAEQSGEHGRRTAPGPGNAPGPGTETDRSSDREQGSRRGPAGGDHHGAETSKVVKAGRTGSPGSAGPTPDHAAPRTAAVGTVEHLGPATLARIKQWLQHSRVTIRPVIDLTHTSTCTGPAVDAHDPPEWMREEVFLRDGHCVFPGCTRVARACDLDHTLAYVELDQGGPAGQTHPGALAALCRRHHRLKTLGRWTYARDPTPPDRPAGYTWTDPYHNRYRVTRDATHQLASLRGPDV